MTKKVKSAQKGQKCPKRSSYQHTQPFKKRKKKKINNKNIF